MSAAHPLRIVLASTPVGPLGSGLGGGVEWTAQNLASGLTRLGHAVEVVAPLGSALAGVPVHGVPGTWQPLMQELGPETPPALAPDAVLARMWRWIAAEQHRFEVVVNLAYDALPFELAQTLGIPVAHLVSMGSLNPTMDHLIAGAAQSRPGSVAVHTRAQAQTFGAIGGCFEVLGSGLEVADYTFCPSHDQTLGFVGRIAPEKGLEDALAIAAGTGKPLKVWGLMQDETYWQRVCAAHPAARVAYQGFLPTAALQAGLGRCQALLMTPKWVEAFGNVAIEAMACGVPVIAYRRGGPGETVTDGLTGFVVAPDDVAGAVAAVGRLGGIDRAACRARVESCHSVQAFATRTQSWLHSLLPA